MELSGYRPLSLCGIFAMIVSFCFVLFECFWGGASPLAALAAVVRAMSKRYNRVESTEMSVQTGRFRPFRRSPSPAKRRTLAIVIFYYMFISILIIITFIDILIIIWFTKISLVTRFASVRNRFCWRGPTLIQPTARHYAASCRCSYLTLCGLPVCLSIRGG